MQIVIKGPAAVFAEATGDEITDPGILQQLDGIVFPDAVCSEWLDDERFDELDVTEGLIEVKYAPEANRLRVTTAYRSPRELVNDELATLVTFTTGQWSDGLGENGLMTNIGGLDVLVSVWSQGTTAEDVTAEQIPERPDPRPRFTKLFRAARTGDLLLLEQAFAAGDDLNVRKSTMTALHWAVAFAHPEAALRLIRRGADVTVANATGSTALESCAASRDLGDQDAARVAAELLKRWVADKTKEQHLRTALAIAENRGKVQLAQLLRRALTAS